MKSRISLLSVAAATLVVVTTSGPAFADDVLAHGAEVDGLCVFDPPVDVPSHTAVAADGACRLIAVRDVQDLLIGPSGTVVPKRMDGTFAGASGGIPTISLHDADGVLGAADALLKQAVGSTAYEIEARRTYWNELGKMMYDDVLAFTYRKSRSDGRISGIVLTEAFCATGAGVYPHYPVSGECTWTPGLMGGDTFSFVSNGVYTDYLLGPDLKRVIYDHRRTTTGFADFSYKPSERYCPIDSLPPRWRTLPTCTARPL